MGNSSGYYLVRTVEHPLNIRNGPGKHYKKLGTLPSGAIVSGAVNNGWLQTTLQGETCYLSMDYLQPIEASCTLCYTADDIKQVISWLEELL